MQAVLLPKRRSAPLNAAALKAAAGGAEALFLVQVSNLARRLEWLRDQGVWVIGAAGEADAVWLEADFGGSAAVVVLDCGIDVAYARENDPFRDRPSPSPIECCLLPGGSALGYWFWMTSITLPSGSRTAQP